MHSDARSAGCRQQRVSRGCLQAGSGRALVTGVAGFIGSHLAERLLGAGWRVLGVDAFTDTYDLDQKHGNVGWLRAQAGFELLEADLATSDLSEVVRDVDVVVHLAAESGVPGSWGPAFAAYCQRNVVATQRLLETVVGSDVQRLVYASSSSVYGDDVDSPTSEEDSPLRPASPYGISKLAGELLVSAYAERGLHGVSLRYFSVYGPRQRPDMAIHRFIEAALAGRPLVVYGRGDQVRDFTYIDDAVTATVAAATSDLAPGAVVNVAGGAPVSVSALVRLLGQQLEAGSLAVRHEPERRGDVGRTCGAIGRAGDWLGWAPATDLHTGLARQIDWHRRRPGPRELSRAAARRLA